MLLSAENINMRNSCAISVWEIGGKHRLVNPPFEPCFYSTMPVGRAVKTTKTLLSTLQQKQLYECFFVNTVALESARSPHTFEDDIPFLQKLALRVGFKLSSQPPKVAAIDIETSSADGVFKPDIIAVAVKSSENEKCFTGAEPDILRDFVEYFRRVDADICVSFNGSEFDWPRILARCSLHNIKPEFGRADSLLYIASARRWLTYIKKRINMVYMKGRQHLDVYVECLLDSSLLGIKHYDLKTVARHFFPDEKILEADVFNMDTLCDAELKRYCLSDANLTLRIAQEVYLPNLYALADMFSLPLNMVFERQPSHLPNYLYGAEYDKRGIVSDKNNEERFPEIFKSEKKIFGGAVVKLHGAGAFFDVKKLDFKSMYPSIMMCFNLDAATVKLAKRSWPPTKFWIKGDMINIPDPKLGDTLLRVDLSYDSVTRGKFVELMHRRAEIKRQLKKDPLNKAFYSQQWAIKVAMNATFGYHGNRYARFGSVLVALATTGIAREYITAGENFVVARGGKLIETDTDGLYYIGPTLSKDFNDYLRSLVPAPFESKYLTVETEEFDAGIFYEEKNYLLKDGENIIFHGSGLKGRHIPRICDDALECAVNSYFAGESVIDSLHQFYRLDKFPYRRFIMTAIISKNPQDYSEDTMYRQLCAEFARRGQKLKYGDEVQYVKTVRGYRAAHFHAPGELLDYKYYKKRIADVLSRVLQPTLGLNTKTIYEFLQGQVMF